MSWDRSYIRDEDGDIIAVRDTKSDGSESYTYEYQAPTPVGALVESFVDVERGEMLSHEYHDPGGTTRSADQSRSGFPPETIVADDPKHWGPGPDGSGDHQPSGNDDYGAEPDPQRDHLSSRRQVAGDDSQRKIHRRKIQASSQQL